MPDLFLRCLEMGLVRKFYKRRRAVVCHWTRNFRRFPLVWKRLANENISKRLHIKICPFGHMLFKQICSQSICPNGQICSKSICPNGQICVRSKTVGPSVRRICPNGQILQTGSMLVPRIFKSFGTQRPGGPSVFVRAYARPGGSANFIRICASRGSKWASRISGMMSAFSPSPRIMTTAQVNSQKAFFFLEGRIHFFDRLF
jgi:hypothetical protein